MQHAAPTAPEFPDLQMMLSGTMLQYALDAYAAESFTDRVFEQPALGLRAIGQGLQLILADQRATIALTLQANVQLAAAGWRVLNASTPLRIQLEIGFRLVNDQLYITVLDSDVAVRGSEKIVAFLTSLVDRITQAVFAQPLITVPLRLDLAGMHANSTDATHLALTAVTITPAALTLALHLRLNDLPLPPMLRTEADAVPRAPVSRARSVRWVREGIAAYRAYNYPLAAAAFARACLAADPSYELAWLWLAEVANSDGEKRYCLERAIAINPDNQPVHALLTRLAATPAVRPGVGSYPLALSQ